VNERANQLAHRLMGAGAGPETLIGICTERAPEMAIAVLAVLKAGAAYLPLDPAYPAQRLQYMLEDAQPLLLGDANRGCWNTCRNGCRGWCV